MQPRFETMPLPRPSRVRFQILALISGCVMINYLDRALLGIAAPALQTEFRFSPATLGLVLSAFSWTYFLGQVPAGILLDRIKVGVIYAGSLFAWSLITLLHAAAAGLASLLSLRCALGLAEAPCFPANNNVVSMWFPRGERARAIAVYTAAEYVGLSFLSPILFWILHGFGWRALFALSGSLGIAYTILLYRGYRDPLNHSGANRAEIEFIVAGGGSAHVAAHTAFQWSEVTELFRHRKMWGLCIGQFAVYSTFVFFLTWFPTYLATARHMTWIKVGVYTALPYVAGFCGSLFAGWWSDSMLRRGYSLNLARKLPVIVGLLGAATIIGANFVNSDALVVTILSVAFFSQAMSSCGWVVLSEIAPPARLGLVGGLFSASANLSGILIPILIGLVLQYTGNFIYALALVTAVAAIGALSWIFLIGDIAPIVIDNAAGRP